MTSSSSLYGTVTTQNTSSGNSTGLYGEAGTPIPDSSGNVVVRGDLLVLSGNILTTATTGNIFPANATTVNLGLAATAVNIGAGTGTTTVNNNLQVDGNLTLNGSFVAPSADFGSITIAVVDGNTISTTSGGLKLSSNTGEVGLVGVDTIYTDQSSFLLLNSPTTITAFDSATTLNLGDVTGTTFIRNDVSIGGDLKINGNNINSNGGTTAITLNGSNVTVANDLTITGDNVNLAQNTSFLYSEAGNRLNRPNFQSTTGNTSGIRVDAPNATSSALSLISAFNTNDNNNGNFIQLYAGNGSTDPLRIRTGGYASGVFAPTGDKIAFQDGNTTYAYVNPVGTTDALDLATKTYVDSQVDSDTTYTINASTTTGGANLNLVGSDSTTDTIKFAEGSGITVSRTDANTITIANTSPAGTTYTQNASSTTGGANLNLVGSDSTTDTIKFADGTGISVSRTDANTITITNTSTGTTYSQNISSTTGGANLNLVGSDSTTDTVKFADGTGVTVAYTDASTATVSIGQAVAVTDAVAFASVTTPTLNSGGASALTITGGAVDPSIITVDGGQTTVALNGGFGGDDATLTLSSGFLQWAHTAGGMGSVSGTWGLNSNGTTSFPSFTFPYADGTSNQVLRTNGSGVLSWYTPSDLNTTYTIDAASTTGGANLNLVGSDSTTDTVKIASGTGVTVSQTNANELSVAIGQAVGTGDSPAFAGVSGGNISVGVATDNTIASTDTNGNIVLDPNGSGQIVMSSIVRAQGELQATTDLNYAWPPSSLVTISDNNGYSAASSIAPGAGNSAAAAYYHYYGDTFAGVNAAPVLNFRSASGNSVAGVNVPFTGLTSVAPSAVTTSGVTGVLTFNGYATTGFGNDVATQYQGGGINSLHSIQWQAFPSETFSDSILTVGSANITAVASSFRSALTTPTVTGTKGQISFGSTTPAVGQAIRVTGTLTGDATGIVSGQTYYIVVTNGSTTATLSATPNGLPIDTTGTTLTGLTLTRCGFTLTLSGQTTIPFGRGALVAVTGITNITDGTYPVVGGPTLTSISLGAGHTVAPTLSGTQSLSCRTAYIGGGYRIRGFPLATPTNTQNRLELVSHTAAAATHRADTFTISGGAYGNTGTARLTVDSAKITAALPVVFPNYTVAALTGASPTLVGAVGWQVAVSNSPTYAGRMAYWSTTATAGWRYVDDNTAV